VLYRSGCVSIPYTIHWAFGLPHGCNHGSWPTNNFPVHIKHYWSKSYEDYSRKLRKWSAWWITEEAKELTVDGFNEKMKGFYEVYDVDMIPFIDDVKKGIDATRKAKI